jgi:solute carrier family 10 (sodium/bile acid cotransporter), member 7
MGMQASFSQRVSLGVLTRLLGRFPLDGFVLALIGTVTLATLLPCQGTSAQVFHAGGWFAIASLFFLQGARLSGAAVAAGAKHWRLHFVVASTTFALFPLLGLGLLALGPHALPRSLWLGVLFVCVLPSTVQSSIALTSSQAAMSPQLFAPQQHPIWQACF